jgi:hypothetical protein
MGGTSPDDFAQADEPEDMPGQDGPQDLGWGFTTDPKTGARRAKRAPGRPKNQPSAEELAAREPLPREPDRAPQRPEGRAPKPLAGAADEPPMPKGGVIAKSVNMLYRRAGKMLRGLESGDPMGVGQALIECTKPDEDGNPTVGEAWENLARVNPRVRAFLLRVLAGGAYADLVMAHAPIGIALMMKPWIQKIIRPDKVMSVMNSMAEPDEDEPEGTAMPGGLTAEDMQAMADLTADQAEQIARKMARGAGIKITSADIAEVRKRAEAEAGGQPGTRRQQPKNRTRAQRAGTR